MVRSWVFLSDHGFFVLELSFLLSINQHKLKKAEPNAVRFLLLILCNKVAGEP